ncbi:probable LRR receptor-like serine/threonine-protein kinase At3g47570 [Medicago truncatula]|nr:probable LRR receptor-like serine/threonine-protein kinase At3g47570 [Medicago truncatula]
MVNLSSHLFLLSLSLHCCFIACLAANTKNITTDQSALLAFKSLITSDPYDVLANNWSTSSSVCNWIGVTCDERHGRVHSLILRNMSLRGTVSPNLGNMSFLVILDLKNNSFGGQFPKELCSLRRLKVLHISYNEFEGGIPPALGNLSQLQYLYLGTNNFNGFIPQSMGNLHGLIELDTIRNKLSGPIPRTISNMSSIEVLHLSSNYFSGTIPEEIGYLDKLEVLLLSNNSLSGSIPSKIFNLSSLTALVVDHNSLSGTLPSNTGYSLPNLQYLHLFQNNFVGNIPNNILNSSKLRQIALETNAFSGTLPNTTFGDLRFLELFFTYNNKLTIEDSHQFFTSLTNCRYLKYLDLSGNHISNLPKSIGNITSEYFRAKSCGIGGYIPLEVGNMSTLLSFDLYDNNINGPIPRSIKGLEKLQVLSLAYNALKGSFIDELCLIKSLGELYIENNKLSGVLPTCLGNMTSLRKLNVGSNNLNSKIPSSLWGLTDILMLDLSSNAFIGDFPPDIGNLRELVILDLSRNQISSNIPTTISSLQNLQNLSLAHNKLNGSIPASLNGMVSLISLDLSQNMLTGVIPKSLESLLYLQNINFSYNRLQGEIPNGGHFKNFTAQSFMHNEALCGDPRLQVPTCGKQVKKWSMEKKLILECILPLVVSAILVVACIILLKHNKRRKNENNVERGLSTLGAPRRISYYELVQATNGFNERNFLGSGGFGSVYQGKLLDGEMIAVKVIDLQSEAKSKSFDAECNAMRNLRHRNLVKIISSCSNLDFKSLVMEFMSNGSVDKWLYSNNYCLNFLQRLNIMIDVASALEYLHHGSSMPVVHCDLKPSNVLLDENMVARVSDFGIAKLMDEGQSKTHTQTLATVGYLAPEYGSKGIVSVKGDVYSYGIMLMEIFTRKKPTDDMFVAELNLKTWINGSLPNSIMEVLDSNLVQQIGEQIDDILTHISSIFGLALSCCEDLPKARINMADVIKSLIKIKTLVLRANRV